ncbi:MAG: DUF4406 domain-containing protein [Adlercreutzia mucosicola]|jgi:hypothetical protein|nr:DUF4406 domain-containing protein [Adlercreutzia mucosicola]
MAYIYISGSVTGCENRNFDAFREAQRTLVDAGHVAIIPHQFVVPSATHEQAMRACINELTWRFGGFSYDGVALLPGWEQSEGARLEKAVAEACGIECRPLADWLGESDAD